MVTMVVLYGVVLNALEALAVNMEMRIRPLMALKDRKLVGRCSSSVRRVLVMLIGDRLRYALFCVDEFTDHASLFLLYSSCNFTETTTTILQ
jgi:hypothetical protein